MPAAVTDGYATAAEYRAAIKKSDSSVDAAILTDLKGMSRVIEVATGRFFTKDAAAVARLFDQRWRVDRDTGFYKLRVGDIASTSNFAIKVDTDRDGSFADETAWDAADYELWPLNAPLGAEAWPWDTIAVPSWSTKSAPVGLRVQVTAIWGWPAVPEAIKRACIELTGILRLETPRANRTLNLTVNEVTSMSRQAADIISALQEAYALEVVV